MSRKSVVKDLRDIFENDQSAKSKRPSEMGLVKNKDLNDKTSAKNGTSSTFKSTSLKCDKINSPHREDSTSMYGTVRQRINKLNSEATLSNLWSNPTVDHSGSNSGIRSSVRKSNAASINSPTATNANLEKWQNDNLSNSEKNTFNVQESKQISNINKEIGSNLIKRHVKEKAEDVNRKAATRSSCESGNFPTIPPKPRYFNKVKAHPDMAPNSKKQLQEKIQTFNSLANCTKEVTASTFKNVNYDRNSNLSESITKSSPDSCIYDIVENNNGSVNLRRSPKPPPIQDNQYDTVGNSKKAKGTSKALKDFKNFRAMSKGHSLEQEGYIVVKDTTVDDYDNFDSSSSDSSSEEELATEYDVIENLNVTKITVERRYKVPDNVEDDSTFNVKRETYYDHNLNPRIEKISRQMQKKQDDCSSCAKHSEKKSLYIMRELLETEFVYFKDLLRVYEDYIVYFKENPDTCGPNISKVFGNFEEIYNHQIDLYGPLTQRYNDVDAIAEIFMANEKLFTLYEKYILNMHISSKYATGECLEVIRARDAELGNKLNLESYLLTPFQRLVRYRLLLKSLQEALINENTPNTKLDAAIAYLNNFIEGTNIHAKIVQGIQNSPIDLSARGRLLMTDDCFIKNNGKKYWSTVILFEDIIMFTRKVDPNTYLYKGSINLSDLYIRSIAEELTSFQLQNFTQFKRKHDNKYVYDLEVTDPKTKQEWVKKIESLLWDQFEAYRR